MLSRGSSCQLVNHYLPRRDNVFPSSESHVSIYYPTDSVPTSKSYKIIILSSVPYRCETWYLALSPRTGGGEGGCGKRDNAQAMACTPYHIPLGYCTGKEELPLYLFQRHAMKTKPVSVEVPIHSFMNWPLYSPSPALPPVSTG
jgi:hypothetical protein